MTGSGARNPDSLLGYVGLERSYVVGLPCGLVEQRPLSLVQLDPRRQSLDDRLHESGAGTRL